MTEIAETQTQDPFSLIPWVAVTQYELTATPPHMPSIYNPVGFESFNPFVSSPDRTVKTPEISEEELEIPGLFQTIHNSLLGCAELILILQSAEMDHISTGARSRVEEYKKTILKTSSTHMKLSFYVDACSAYIGLLYGELNVHCERTQPSFIYLCNEFISAGKLDRDVFEISYFHELMSLLIEPMLEISNHNEIEGFETMSPGVRFIICSHRSKR